MLRSRGLLNYSITEGAIGVCNREIKNHKDKNGGSRTTILGMMFELAYTAKKDGIQVEQDTA